MAVFRIKSRKVLKSKPLVRHLVEAPNEEMKGIQILVGKGVEEEYKKLLLQERERIEKLSRIEQIEELFKTIKQVESVFGEKTIRKDASMREIIIACEAGEDCDARFKQFLKEFVRNFSDKLVLFVFKHEKDNREHFHILVPLRKLGGDKKKIEFTNRHWIKFLQKVLNEEEKKRINKKNRVGNIPLWVVRSIENALRKELGEKKAQEIARKLVQLGRRYLTRKEIFELKKKNADELLKIYKKLIQLERMRESLKEVIEEEEGLFKPTEPNQKRRFRFDI